MSERSKSGDSRQLCLHLRSKEMFYEADPEEKQRYEREMERVYGRAETAAYWCDCTQTSRGPDDQPVARESCCRPGRECYESAAMLAARARSAPPPAAEAEG